MWIQTAVELGASVVTEPYDDTDELGTVRIARIKTFGDVVHTFLDKLKYTGPFLPGFQPLTPNDPLDKLL